VVQTLLCLETKKQKGKEKCPLGKWLEKKKEKCWEKMKRGEKEGEGCRAKKKKEVVEENKEGVEEVRVEENKEEVKEVRIKENKEEVEKKPMRRLLMEDMDYLGNIEDYLTVAVYEMCGCEDCGGCMIM